ncbi:MAG TPA: GMC family oxidoreductase [Thermoanaerobaculia bacterium]|nr:GMC family oxidoreductase [Thermoanaerobaculia bacterium]
MPDEAYDYIVVGSGAGGGPLAANLAVRGFRVLLIEAGSDPESYNYQVPCFHALSTEEKEMAWSFYVHHYDTDEERDKEKYVKGKGILYPRAGTLGGCTAHNAMITVVPHDNDWEGIADLTGDESWRAKNMWQYFQRVERCLYQEAPAPGYNDPTGHGYEGWLGTSKVDPAIGLGDAGVARMIIGLLHTAAERFGFRRAIGGIVGEDPNDQRNRAALEGVTTTIPLATNGGKRNGAREFIRKVQAKHPDLLTIRMDTLATRVILDANKRAVGVECWEGKNLYRADPNPAEPPVYEKKEYRCSREVILAGGAFNTPQLLMLSGIGPKAHLEDPNIGIPCLVDRPGVGCNLQDRYEVGVVSKMKQPFTLLQNATFKPSPADPCFQDWQQGKGVYTSNGAMAAVILKSDLALPDPDLFIFALPGDFHGYYPGYSESIVAKRDTLTWAIVKAHTNNTGGKVRLKSSNPRDTPVIDFHYFEEGTDPTLYDLEGVVRAVDFVRRMNQENGAIEREITPGPEIGYEQLGDWIRANAWGHHASCSCKMGKPDDPKAVVDSRFRVIGTEGLRIVDASVFPHIPGFFIVTPIYMISEKAADVIVEDAKIP